MHQKLQVFLIIITQPNPKHLVTSRYYQFYSILLLPVLQPFSFTFHAEKRTFHAFSVLFSRFMLQCIR
jgi:hypothetical protein